MNEKIFGYFLLVIGILLICYSFWSVYQILGVKKSVSTLFNLPGISIDFGSYLGGDVPKTQEMNADSELKSELVSSDVISEPINFIANIIIYTFFVNVGFKLAMLGVNLVRPLKVKLREGEIRNNTSDLKGKGVSGKTW